MKKFVKRLMPFVVAVSLLGCGKAGASNESDPSQNTVSSQPEKTAASESTSVSKQQTAESKPNESKPAKELTNEEKAALFSDFLLNKDVMYGRSCTFTLQRNQEAKYDRWWDGISKGAVLGFSVEDFDSDGSDELFLLTLYMDNKLQLEMYEVINGEVKLADMRLTDTGTSHGAMELPCGSRTDGGICGMLSCLVQEADNRIFIQSSDSYGLVTDGCNTFIASTVYKDGKFGEYAISFEVGSSIDESIPRMNQELSDMGVPNPDFASIFYSSTPLINCYDSGAHEILRAQQGTTEFVRENGARTKIQTITVFATRDGRIEMPELYQEVNEQYDQEETGGITYNEYGYPDWFESYPYWKHSSGEYVCCVTGNTGGDLTFDFSDGVNLRGDICYYSEEPDGTFAYAYKKGWSVSYDPENNIITSYCDPTYTQSTNQGDYYPISEEEYNAFRASLG